MVRNLFARAVCLLGIGASLVQAAAPDLEVAPTEGIWWSSEAPGTGVAFNIDKEGRWFAALYLYDTEGAPTFLTMQGESIEYTDADVHEPYAVIASPLIASEGGQCLKCPWTQATTSASGDGDAEILFYSRNRAQLNVGDWSLRLAPMVDEVEDLAPGEELPAEERFALDRDYYSVTFETSGINAVVLASPIQADQSPGTPHPNDYYILECKDCRVPNAGEPATSQQEEALAGRLNLQSFRFMCDRNEARNCMPRLRSLDAEFQMDSYFINQNGDEIILIDHGDGEVRAPGKVVIRALPEGWSPGFK